MHPIANSPWQTVRGRLAVSASVMFSPPSFCMPNQCLAIWPETVPMARVPRVQIERKHGNKVPPKVCKKRVNYFVNDMASHQRPSHFCPKAGRLYHMSPRARGTRTRPKRTSSAEQARLIHGMHASNAGKYDFAREPPTSLQYWSIDRGTSLA